MDAPGLQADRRTGMNLPCGRAAFLCATACGAGLSPFAPGTAGSLVGVALWYAAACAPAPWHWGVHGGILLVLLATGVWSGSRMEEELGVTDPHCVVIDEVAGMLITLTGVQTSVTAAALGFVLFRLLDILKPFPICRLQRLTAGWGIMADDAAAGVVSALVLRLILHWL